MPKKMPRRVSRKLPPIYLPPLLLLAACATPTPPCSPALPTLPDPPPLMQPPPSGSYLEHALKNIETWRIKLTAMPVTSEP